MNTLWSGRIVDNPHDAMSYVLQRGTSTFVVQDLARGVVPGTLRWERRFGEPPIGWVVVGEDPPWAEVFIARRWYSVPIRLVLLVRAYLAWFRMLVEAVRRYWRQRPPLRVK